jgi:hypothetical protein
VLGISCRWDRRKPLDIGKMVWRCGVRGREDPFDVLAGYLKDDAYLGDAAT